jgi:cobaltochelatase CobS
MTTKSATSSAATSSASTVNMSELRLVNNERFDMTSNLFPFFPKNRYKDNKIGLISFKNKQNETVQHPLVRDADDNFVLTNIDAFRVVLMSMTKMMDSGRGLWISGPTGSGKSEMIRYIFNKLGYPYLELNGSVNTEKADLVGRMSFKPDQGSVFQYGPLPKAMIYGIPLIIHEGDLLHSQLFTGLNKVLEGGSYEIEANGGQIVYPKKGFKLIITANTAGNGSVSADYQRRKMDASVMRRFDKIEYGYPEKDIELSILTKRFPNSNNVVLESFVDFANLIRESAEKGASIIPMPISTGSLISLVEWYESMSPVNLVDEEALKPINYALSIVFTSGLSLEQKIAFYRAFDNSMNNNTKKSLQNVWGWTNDVKKEKDFIPKI